MLIGFETIGTVSSALRENVGKVKGLVASSIPVFTNDLHRKLQASNAAYTEGRFQWSVRCIAILICFFYF